MIRSDETVDYNAIDPAVVRSDDGTLWMAFGSFWTGIKLIELDPRTGKRIAGNSPVYDLAHKEQIEAVALYRHGDYWYQFVNWGWCCRGVKVEATVPEAVAVAAFLRDGRTADEQARIARDARDRADATRHLDASARWAAKTPCAFLDTASGACTIYAARPFVCRSHASFDADACESAAADPSAQATVPRHVVPAHVYDTAKTAVVTACEQAGLDARHFELASAVAVALGEPSAAERWLDGERLFDAAVIPSDERDRARSLRLLQKSGLLSPERLIAHVKSRPERNAAKRARRERRSKR